MTNNTKAATIAGWVIAVLFGTLIIVGFALLAAWSISTIIAGTATVWGIATGILSINALYGFTRLLNKIEQEGILQQ